MTTISPQAREAAHKFCDKHIIGEVLADCERSHQTAIDSALADANKQITMDTECIERLREAGMKAELALAEQADAVKCAMEALEEMESLLGTAHAVLLKVSNWDERWAGTAKYQAGTTANTIREQMIKLTSFTPTRMSRAADLSDALKSILEAWQNVSPYVITQTFGCGGEKCREPQCYSCNGQEDAEEAAAKAEDAYSGMEAAVAKLPKP